MNGRRRIGIKRWLNNRSVMWRLFLAAYAIAIILLHKEGNLTAGRLNESLGLPLYLSSTRLVASIGGLVILFFVCRDVLNNPPKLKKLLMFVPFAAVVDSTMTSIPIEKIHYLQYGLLTLIAYKAIGEPLTAAMMTFLIGYVDEAYQYWVLYADDRFVYFDWNDIAVNLTAVLFVLLFLLPEENSVRRMSTKHVIGAVLVWIVAAGTLVSLLDPDRYLMGNQPGNSFWTTSNINTKFHVMNSLEGSIILGIILIVAIGYHLPGRRVVNDTVPSEADLAREPKSDIG